ncbi:MAG: ABC transporter ATP-binding protein [Methanospirillum sp.]|nr:ABC transporter ATP-binding protein [Methanospirillum sp.]
MKLVVEGVSKEYVGNNGEPVVALKGISLEVPEGEFVCILGPSGCGKTTLLRIIAGLERPTEGRVLVDGEEVDGPTPRLGMIFQDYSLFPWRRVIDNISFGLELAGVEKADRAATAREYLDLVGLGGFASAYPYELSGGMRQRVAVARALATNPAVVLMDEPFGALDAQTRNAMQREILEIWEKTRKTVLFVTHSVDEAVFLADRIVVLTARPGRIREVATFSEPRPRNRTSDGCAALRRYVLGLIDEGQGGA